MRKFYQQTAIKPLAFKDTCWTSGFWKLKEDLCIHGTLDSVYEGLNNPENSASFKNFYLMAGLETGEYAGSTYWSDGDCYKWLEAACYVYAKNKDALLKAKIDKEVSVIAKAQCADGYIHAYIQLENKPRLAIRMYHEDYNFGHLFTAAAVHHTLLMQDDFLNVAVKAADYLYREFTKSPVEYPHFGWDPSHIMGLADLYRATGDQRYLELAYIFVELKGSAPVSFEYDSADAWEHTGWARTGGDQNQDRTKLREEDGPEGHAVDATYLYAGAADICTEMPNAPYLPALEAISRHLYASRIYLTGGVGPQHQGVSEHLDPVHEAFDRDYHLPLSTAYNETCANIGNAMWHWRLFLLTGKPEYADHVENVMYNSGISGMSVDGKKFRYTNPLKFYGQNHDLLSNDTVERWTSHSCYCCPPQMARTMSSMNRYVAVRGDNSLYLTLYGGCEIDTVVDGKRIKLAIETRYPWDGAVSIHVLQDIADFTLFLRVPSWSTDTRLTVNGQAVGCEPGSFASISRNFRAGDGIELSLDMRVRKMRSNALVEASKNMVTLMRGPLVYCVEQCDLPGRMSVDDVYLDKDCAIESRFEEDLLLGVVTLNAKGYAIESLRGALYGEWVGDNVRPVDIKLIPYFAWNNRGPGEMTTWLPQRSAKEGMGR